MRCLAESVRLRVFRDEAILRAGFTRLVASGMAHRMTDTPPDRLAAHPSSPYHDADALQRGVGVRFKDVERNDVDEYCLSEGWIKVALGKKVDRRGAALTIKLTGPVEVWFRDAANETPSLESESQIATPPGQDG